MVVCSAPVVPLVEVRLTVPYAATEPGEVTRCQLLAAVLLRGTAHRDADGYDAALAAHGATLNAAADADKLTVAGHTMADALPAVLALLAETVREPRLTRDVVLPEREALARRVRLATHQPAALAQHALLRRRYGEEVAARRQPAPEQAAACTPDDLAELHTRGTWAPGARCSCWSETCGRRKPSPRSPTRSGRGRPDRPPGRPGCRRGFPAGRCAGWSDRAPSRA
ncbi:insulinase family protein [Streptomyces thinghirensis]|nr:insulinase family protein [Streptomyces thinghirensis]